MGKESILSDEQYRKIVLDDVLWNEILTGQAHEYTVYQAERTGLESPIPLLEHCALIVSGVERAVYRRFGIDAHVYSEIILLLWKRLESKIAEMGYRSHYVMQIYDDTKRLVYIIAPMKEFVPASVEQVAKLVHQSVQTVCDQAFLAGETMFSNFTVYDEIGDGQYIGKRFEQLCKIHELIFFLPPQRVLTQKMLDSMKKPVTQSELLQDVRDLFIHVYNTDHVEVMLLLKGTIFAKLSQSYDRALCHQITSQIINRSIEADQVFELNMEEEFHRFDPRKIPTLSLLEQEIERLLSKIINAISKTKQHYGPLTRSAILYIKQHYREDIALQTLADRADVAPAYLSRTFNREVGESIPSYILRLRIQDAREQLISTGKSAAEIARENGFSNASYFSKLFRVQTGMSPSAYRDAYRKD